MTFKQKKELFDLNNTSSLGSLIRFKGVEGYDVYNPSVPFIHNGERYIYGRVERRGEWARSWVRLFRKSAEDEFTLVDGSMVYQLEDPFVSEINGEHVLGGTHVRYKSGKYETFYSYFYKGKDLNDLYYFTTGPEHMKDIRLVQMPNGIGVFSRPKDSATLKRYGTISIVGFTSVASLMHLTADAINDATPILGMFDGGEWGGCNQCYPLDSGLIGIIAHKSYESGDASSLTVYTAVSYVFDPKSHTILDEKIIATRKSFPDYPAKKPSLCDCIFPSGVVFREDGRADLYAGLGDTCVGRITIPNPFKI